MFTGQGLGISFRNGKKAIIKIEGESAELIVEKDGEVIKYLRDTTPELLAYYLAQASIEEGMEFLEIGT